MSEVKNLDILSKVFGQPLKPHNPVDRNGNVYFKCPFCNHHNKKLTINVKTELWNCFVCETRGRSLVRLLIKSGNHNYASILKKNKYHDFDLDKIFNTQKEQEEKKDLLLPKKYQPIFNNQNKEFFKPAIDYLYKRGLQQEDILRYDIHYSITEQRVLFPSYDENEELNYYVGRSINPREKIKYSNATIPKKNVIFNEHLIKWNEELYLVEGIFDCIASRKNAVPILGSSLNEGFKLFKKIVRNKTKVIMALDSDARRKSINIADKLINFGVDVGFVDWSSGEQRDISEMGSEEFLKIASSGAVRSVDFKDIIKEKLFT